MSKYSSLPGYDPNQQTIYGDEEAHSLPEDDRDWKGMFSSDWPSSLHKDDKNRFFLQD